MRIIITVVDGNSIPLTETVQDVPREAVYPTPDSPTPSPALVAAYIARAILPTAEKQ